MYEAGNPKLVLYDNLGWERGGRGGSGERGHMSACGQFMSTYGKNITIW